MFPKPAKREKARKRLRATPGPVERTVVKGDVLAHRDPRILEHVRYEPCIRCGAPGPSDPHHVSIGTGHRRGVDLVVPLCRKCHDLVQQALAPEPRQWAWAALAYWEDVYEIDLMAHALPAVLDALTPPPSPAA